MFTVRAFVLFAAAAVGVTGLAAREQQKPAPQAQQQVPVFRGRTTVVPIDVRVLDRNGRPVTDLTTADFTVLENGVPQKIEYFATQTLRATPPDPDATVRTTDPRPETLGPQTRRVFLIYLGRGRLQEPSKGVDATLRFVRERLLPQDQVAVMAWNRATDFSTDHKRAAAVIERFRRRHEEVEHEIRLYFSGLFGLYAGKEMPLHIQKLIDAVFDIGPAATTRQVLAPGTLTAPAERDIDRNVNNALMRADLESYAYFGFSDIAMTRGLFDASLDMSFDGYISLNRQTLEDVGNLYAGIDFLRFIEGEKHLIYITEQGHFMPRAEHDRDLAWMAADARVAIDTIQTGGVNAVQGGDGSVSVMGGFNLTALRRISEISGGQTSVSKTAEAAYDRILSATEFGYLLGYTSTNPKADGRVRRVKVEVTRKGVTLAHRQAYTAWPDDARFDPRESLAQTRLVAAAALEQDLADLRLTTRLLDTREGDQRFVNVEVVISGEQLRLAKKGDDYIAALNFAVFAGDFYRKEIGQLWESKDIIVPPTRVEEIKRVGLTVTLKVPVRQPPSYVKIVAYDYGSDRVGSVLKKMR